VEERGRQQRGDCGIGGGKVGRVQVVVDGGEGAAAVSDGGLEGAAVSDGGLEPTVAMAPHYRVRVWGRVQR
jgi:hypothetical protein